MVSMVTGTLHVFAFNATVFFSSLKISLFHGIVELCTHLEALDHSFLGFWCELLRPTQFWCFAGGERL